MMTAESLPLKPTVVTLCGSTRFRQEFTAITRIETLAGHIVISVGCFGHQEGMDMDGEVKRMLDTLHLRKIDISHEIYVINPGGYIGDSTRREIAHARAMGKGIRSMEPIHE